MKGKYMVGIPIERVELSAGKSGECVEDGI